MSTHLVEERTGRSVGEIFRRDGEDAFRRMESAEIQCLAAETAGYGEGTVISTGGGAVLDDRSVEAMRRTGVVLWLDAPPPSLAARVGHERPLLAGQETASRLGTILDRRRHLYEAAAHYRVDADRPASAVAADAARYARVPVGESSEVLIGPGLPARLLPASAHREKAVVIAQPGAMVTAGGEWWIGCGRRPTRP